MNKCEKCGFLHYRTDPCRKPKESTAALMEVREKGLGELETRSLEADSQYPLRSSVDQPAGTQALPVDTKSRRGRPKMEAPTSARADYQRAYMAKYRRGEVGNKYRKET